MSKQIDNRRIFPKKCFGCANANMCIPGFCELQECNPKYDNYNRAKHDYALKNLLKDVLRLGE